MSGLIGQSSDPNAPGILGENTGDGGAGVYGRDNSIHGGGVIGHSDNGRGVYGESQNGHGVWGYSKESIAIVGESVNNEGVRGISHSAHGGVVGVNDWAANGQPLGTGGNGGWFESLQGEGVRGMSKNPHHGGVVGVNTSGGVGVYGEGRIGGFFKGDVEVTGDIRMLSGHDCAEDFEIAERVEPGTVVVLGEEGVLRQSRRAYDKCVAGVVSGAGDFKPGIILGDHDPSGKSQPIGLVGRVFCKVDAQSAPIEVGDLLTTSSTPGHAMKAGDPMQAFGAVIGKALRPLKEGLGLIPILIALQ